MTLTTNNIDQVKAVALDPPRGWKITFRSENHGMHHQLYVNGRLADWADTTDQRCFILAADASPREILIAAVDTGNRTKDMSKHLSVELAEPDWVYRSSVVRSISYPKGWRVALLTDHATGQIDPTPVMSRELWPDWTVRWAWGESAFGLGGFGYDGIGAPGLGQGAFGAASFGIETDLLPLSTVLEENGTHKIVLRTITAQGQSADAETQNVDAHPPPAPPASAEVTDYDSQTTTMTLQIE